MKSYMSFMYSQKFIFKSLGVIFAWFADAELKSMQL